MLTDHNFSYINIKITSYAGGLAEKCGKLQIGDELLSINGESVLNKPLSEAIKLLQQSGQRVQLQLCRKVTGKV